MSIVAIYLNRARNGPMDAVDAVRAEEGRGLVGNRYFGPEPGSDGNPIEPEREVTLIEAEAVEALPRDEGLRFEAAESRRNLVTRGVALNHLVGQTFRVGGAVLEGIKLCEPCKHLEALTRPRVLKALLHRGGLRARIVSGGLIRRGDPVASIEEGVEATWPR